MSCTTILVGKKASYDGSTIIARDDDSGSGRYDPKKFIAVAPQDQPRHYRSVLSHVEIDLPDNPCRYSIVPNVLPNRGILAEAGVNERNVAMSATETIAVNERVLAADPLVELQPANEAADTPEIPGGIGEEDIITLVLPYVTTAREGVARLAELLETYGTYESNGIIISDVNEIWYVETIGGPIGSPAACRTTAMRPSPTSSASTISTSTTPSAPNASSCAVPICANSWTRTTLTAL